MLVLCPTCPSCASAPATLVGFTATCDNDDCDVAGWDVDQDPATYVQALHTLTTVLGVLKPRRGPAPNMPEVRPGPAG